MSNTPTTKLRADFGEVTDDDLLSAFTTPILALNEQVLLRDEDGNACYGVVRKIAGKLCYVEPNWNTWIAADTFLETAPAGAARVPFRVHVEAALAPGAGSSRRPARTSPFAIAYA